MPLQRRPIIARTHGSETLSTADRILACTAGFMFAISSRNSVPPSACSK